METTQSSSASTPLGLERVHLTDEQTLALQAALDAGVLDTELTDNLTILIDNFCGSRFLPVPPINAHVQVEGSGRIYAGMLMKGPDAYVLLFQVLSEGERAHVGPGTVQAEVVLGANLPFLQVDPTQGDWPLRVRRTLQDITQWTCEQGRLLTDTQRQQFALWRNLLTDQTARMFGADQSLVRAIYEGHTRARAQWQDWATNEVDAIEDFALAVEGKTMVKHFIAQAIPRRSKF